MLRSLSRRLDKIETKIKAACMRTGPSAMEKLFLGFDEAHNAFKKNLIEAMAEFGIDEFSDEYEEKKFRDDASSFCSGVTRQYYDILVSRKTEKIETGRTHVLIMNEAMADKEVLMEYVKIWKFLKEHRPEVLKRQYWLERGEIFFEKEKIFARGWKPVLKS